MFYPEQKPWNSSNLFILTLKLMQLIMYFDSQLKNVPSLIESSPELQVSGN